VRRTTCCWSFSSPPMRRLAISRTGTARAWTGRLRNGRARWLENMEPDQTRD